MAMRVAVHVTVVSIQGTINVAMQVAVQVTVVAIQKAV